MINYQNDIKHVVENYQLDKHMIKRIMNELKNNKSRGYHEVSNEMFKYACNDAFTDIIANLFEKMFNLGVILDKLNVGKIYPIIEDAKKSNRHRQHSTNRSI